MGMTGIDRKDDRFVSMSEHDCSLRYQMMIEQQMAIITSHWLRNQGLQSL